MKNILGHDNDSEIITIIVRFIWVLLEESGNN